MRRCSRLQPVGTGILGTSMSDIEDSSALASDRDAEVHLSIADALGRIGPEARYAGPQLQRPLGDSQPEVRGQAVVAPGAIALSAQGAVPVLTDVLVDPDHDVRAGRILRSAIHA